MFADLEDVVSSSEASGVVSHTAGRDEGDEDAGVSLSTDDVEAQTFSITALQNHHALRVGLGGGGGGKRGGEGGGEGEGRGET